MGLAGLSLAIQAWQFAVAWWFPLHRRGPGPRVAAPVSILKPVRGADPNLRSCLESWLRQDYGGPMEVLFLVAQADDPACVVIRGVLEEHPGADARLVIGTDGAGVNAKVAKLVLGERTAKHGHLIVSDADVRAPAHLVSELMGALEDPGTGIANAFYRLANPVTPALRCEAVSVNADFWSQVLQSCSLHPQDFALGAVMALRRTDLAAAGGFASVADHLADDFQIGRRIRALGLGIRLIGTPVDCWDPPAGWGSVWMHQLRWSRTIRVCRPWPFLASIVCNGTFWAMAWLVSALALRMSPWAAAGALLIRPVLAQALYARMCRGLSRGVAPWWVWIRDLQAAVLWAAAFLGDTIVWRGDRFRVNRDGKLTRLDRAG